MDKNQGKNEWTVTIEELDDSWKVVPANSDTRFSPKYEWQEEIPLSIRFRDKISKIGLRWPSTEKQLRKSIRICQMWCDKENAGTPFRRKLSEIDVEQIKAEVLSEMTPNVRTHN